MTAANRSFVILAIIWLLSIADTLDPDSTKQYDFEFDSSIYKIMLDTAPKIEAEKMCASFYNGGHLVIINQRSELDEMVKELLSRQVGEKLEYWVSGNTTQNTEFTSSILEFTSQTGECKTTMFGLEYRGNISLTKEGLTCQRWDLQTPHQHTKDNPLYLGDAAANHCRNPDSEPDGPWCYTTDPDTRWQFCDVPTCKVSECRVTRNGSEYNGEQWISKSGKTCQRWDAQTPQPNSATFPDSSVADAQNYCRNPDNKPGGPWCYTADPDTPWESCEIPYCWLDCKVTRFGNEYMGKVNRTASGIPCQRWDMDYPHQHDQDTNKFPDGSRSAAENYCRNPDLEAAGPWCYTIDPNTRWQNCHVPMCADDACDILRHTQEDNVMLVTASCKGTRPFICEQELYDPGPMPVERIEERSDSNNAGESKKSGSGGNSCGAPCIGMLASYPFILALVSYLTLVGYRYYVNRQIPCSFCFRKQSDEVLITP